MEILNEYEENGYKITEYTQDGTTVSHRVEALIVEDAGEPIIRPETLEDKIILLEKTIEENNLVSLDIQLGLYEQILLLQTQSNGGN